VEGGVSIPNNDDAGLTADDLRAVISGAEAEGQEDGPATSFGEDDSDGPSDMPVDNVSLADVEWCAALDHSDTDNGKRLLRHRGADLANMLEEGSDKANWLVWTGKVWDQSDGSKQALAIAQSIGGLIGIEAEFLNHTPSENAAIRKGLAEPTEDNLKAKAAASLALEKRQGKRRAFGVSSKNLARMNAMLTCSAPFCVVKPEAWNADQRLVYVANGTLRFVREEDVERSGEMPAYLGRVDFTPHGWRREHRVTRLVPVAYDPTAQCPRWRAMIARFLPEELVPGVARVVQIYSGLGLTGLPVQRLFFHYGTGANSKSVFLEVLARVLGPLCEGLPAESISGQSQNAAGGASPDLARLPGVRFLRITELPQGEPLREALVKRLTGGEKIDVRTLFKGYFSFQPQFKAHLSGNGYPTISGSDHGIWRRMAVVPWKVTIPEAEQRDFEEVVQELVSEAPGILNWLIAMVDAAKEYRDEMDPISLFIERCIRPADPAADAQIRANFAYEAYTAWSEASGKKPRSQTSFGRVMGARFQKRETNSGNVYVDVELHDVPLRPSRPRNPDEEPFGGP
jgi:putative DNA primase/helicase